MKPSPSADCLFLLRSLVLTDLDSTLPLVRMSGFGIADIWVPPAASPGAVQTGEELEVQGEEASLNSPDIG